MAIATAVGLYALRMFAVTAFYHRYFSHRAFKTSRALQFCSRCSARPPCSAGRCGGPRTTAITTPTPTGPPMRTRRANTASSGATWAGSSRAPTSRRSSSSSRTSRAFPSSSCWIASTPPYRRSWPRRYTPGALLERFCAGDSAPTACSFSLWGFAVSTVAVWHATFAINSLAHTLGRRRYATRDDSRNSFGLALLTFGEGWHNNHHRYPAAARQGFRWWEIDLTYYALRVLAATGLIWDLRAVPLGHSRRRRARGAAVKIAIVGAGIAGNTAAYRLQAEHDVTVFEADDYVGGHTHTVDVEHGGVHVRGRHGLHRVQRLDLSRASSPCSPARCRDPADDDELQRQLDERTGLEYNGTSLAALFAAPAQSALAAFLRMLVRRRSLQPRHGAFSTRTTSFTLGDLLAERRYCRLLPRITSSPWPRDLVGRSDHVHGYPARFLLASSHNHGLLRVDDQPQWRTIKAARRATSTARRAAPRPDPARDARSTSSAACRRRGSRRRPGAEQFDAVLSPATATRRCALLADPTPLEREVLGAIRYQPNVAILHTDERCCPAAGEPGRLELPRAGAAPTRRVALTYHLNTLQRLTAPVSLRDAEPQRGARARPRASSHFVTHHPVFDAAAAAAQARHAEIDGGGARTTAAPTGATASTRTASQSALEAARHFNERVRHAELHLRRTG